VLVSSSRAEKSNEEGFIIFFDLCLKRRTPVRKEWEDFRDELLIDENIQCRQLSIGVK
jgi:hypothetical protein